MNADVFGVESTGWVELPGSVGRGLTARVGRVSKSTPIGDAAVIYIRSRLATDEIAFQTADCWRRLLRRFVKYGPGKGAGPVCRLSERQVQRWVNDLPSTLAASTKRNHLAAARGFCDWLVCRKALEANPIRTLGLRFRVVHSRVPRHLSAGEVRALYAAIPSDDRRGVAIVTLMFQIGLRRGAVAGIRMGDIDQTRAALILRREHAKTGVESVKPVPVEAMAAIRSYLTACPPPSSAPDLALFRSVRNPYAGLTPAWISKQIRNWMRDAGIYQPGRCAHALRHTMAVNMLEITGDIYAVNQMLDHAKLESTKIYAGVLALDRLRPMVEGRTYWRSTTDEAALNEAA